MRMKTKVTCDFKGLDILKKALIEADKKEGRAGFDDSVKHKKSGQPLSLIAYYNTMGSPGGKIPQRPFMQDAAKDSSLEVKQQLANYWGYVLKGKPVDKPLMKAAEKVSKWITNTIKTNSYEPNKKSTLRKKEGSQPLVDTKQLMNSVRTGVHDKGD